MRSLVGKEVLVLTEEERRKGKNLHWRGKAPPYISFLPRLLSHLKRSVTFYDLPLINNICQDSLVILDDIISY